MIATIIAAYFGFAGFLLLVVLPCCQTQAEANIEKFWRLLEQDYLHRMRKEH